jgi:hypothetical protein
MLIAEATEPIAVQTFISVDSSARGVHGFEGVPATMAASRLYLPLFRASQYVRRGDPASGRYDTGVAVANPGSEAVDATIQYYGATGLDTACRDAHIVGPTMRIEPRSSALFYQGDTTGQGLPRDCFGAAVVEATGPIVGMSVDALNEGQLSAAYSAATSRQAATRVFLPLFRRNHFALTTGIAVMNVGDETALVTLKVTASDEDGTTRPLACANCVISIPPLSSGIFWPPAMESVPQSLFGSAVVESTQPVVAIVNDVSVSGAVDMATYNGIPESTEACAPDCVTALPWIVQAALSAP